jgi:polyferredoxin
LELVINNIQGFFREPRHLVQLAVFLLTLGSGVQFFVYVRQAQGTGPITVQRPPGVEGFLPIGALMGWKHFLSTGVWNTIHPAGMVIFGWAILVSIMMKKAFCGWFCPMGTVSEWCWRTGRSLMGKNLRMPAVVDVLLRGVKYLLLGFFVWSVSTMSLSQTAAFLQSPYYRLADVKMLYFFTRMTSITALVLSGLLILSLFFKNFWCRYLCPYGALLGVAALMSPTGVRRSENRCTRCRSCERVCPAELPVSRKKVVRSPECTGCMDCVVSCPVEDALVFSSSWMDSRFWTPRRMGLFIVLFFALTVYLAGISGHWYNGVSDELFRFLLADIDSPGNTHPSF